MSLGHGASVVKDGLIFHLDAANKKSYPGKTGVELVTNSIITSLDGNTFNIIRDSNQNIGLSLCSVVSGKYYIVTYHISSYLGTTGATFRINNSSGNLSPTVGINSAGTFTRTFQATISGTLTIVGDNIGTDFNLDYVSVKELIDNTGNTWTDLSGNNNNGTLINGVGYYTNDKFIIDASDDYISVSTGYTGTTWTLMLWHLNIGPAEFSSAGHRTFVSSDTFRLQWDDTNSTTIARGPFVDFTASTGGGQAMYSTTMEPADIFNKWYLVGVTSSPSTVKTFYNTNVTNQSTVINSSRPFSTNGIISIGVDNLSGIGGADRLNRDGGDVFISNCVLYNRELSAQEIQQNFEALRGRYGI